MKQYFLRFGAGDPRQYTGIAPTFIVFKTHDGTDITPPSISQVGASTGIYTFAWGTTSYIGFLADAATTSPGSEGRYVVGALDPADRTDEYGTSLMAFGTSIFALGTSHVAQGVSITAQAVSIIAQNVSLTAQSVSLLAQGSTITGYGVSAFAQGSTLFGFGVSLTAQGLTISGQATTLSAQNLTLSGMGTSLTAQGVSLVALGTSSVALGTSIYSALGSVGSGSSVAVQILAAVGATTSTFGDSSTDPGTLYGHLKRIQEFLEGDATFTKSSGVWAVKSRGGSLLASKTLANSSSTVTKD